MTIKIRISKDYNMHIDTVYERKCCSFRYSISAITGYIDIWMGVGDDELETFCEEIAKYYHIEDFDVYYKRHKWEYRKGRIIRRKVW